MPRNFDCVQSDDFGRYLISKKHFNQGDVVWEECPLLSGPVAELNATANEDCRFTCVGCHKEVEDVETCALCHWPCCSIGCSQNENHKSYECKIFSALGIKATHGNFGVLVYLRMLLTKEVDPEKYGKILTLCFKDSEEDEQFRIIREESTKTIWTFLVEECKINVTMEEVSRMYSAFQTNGFNFSHKENGIKFDVGAFYLFASLFQHSCQHNLQFMFMKKIDNNGNINWSIQFTARETIEPGDSLNIAYSEDNLKFGTIVRRHRLFRSHNFFCMCSRCTDKTEGGTLFQAMVCFDCREGNLLPEDPIEISNSPWSCDKCESTQNADTVMRALEDLCTFPYSLLDEGEFDVELDEMEAEVDLLELVDQFIETKVNVLHRSHFLMNICAVHWLLESDFTEQLLSPGQVAKDLFAKIMKRVGIYLPLCMKFMPPFCSADLLMVVAKAYAAYTLKSEDMRTFVDGDFLLSFKLKMCRRISSFVEKSMVWKDLYPYGVVHANLDVSVLWSTRVEELEIEMERLEEQALMSIRYLFH